MLSVNRAIQKGTWVRAREDMREILRALNAYALAHDGNYPVALSALESTYGRPLPYDPYTKREFFYFATGKGFRLACLGLDQKPGGEDIPDRDIIFDEKGMRE